MKIAKKSFVLFFLLLYNLLLAWFCGDGAAMIVDRDENQHWVYPTNFQRSDVSYSLILQHILIKKQLKKHY